MTSPTIDRVAIAGLGAIGTKLAESLLEGVPGYELTAVAARDLDRVRREMPRSVAALPVGELHHAADLVLECAPAALLRDIVVPFISTGRKAVVLSCGALLAHDDLVDIARDGRGQIVVPSGALLGLDAVNAAAEGEIQSVKMVSAKPVTGLLGAPYFDTHNIDITTLTTRTRVFQGTPREAAVGFPANLNVAVAVSLAGIGPDRTELELWADPQLTRNTHEITVVSDSATFTVRIENVPSENPKTGRITAQSVIACLRRMKAPLSMGT